VVVWNDVVYWANAVAEQPELGRELGTGSIPPCKDTTDGDAWPGSDVPVRAIAGVAAEVAVTVERDPSREPAVYLAPGYLVESRAHPLHDLLYDAAEEPDKERGLECAPPVEFDARAATTPGPVLFRVESEDDLASPLLARHDEGTVFLDSNTIVWGLERDGLPYIAEGDELELVVRDCSGEDGVRVLVAKSVTRL
jgi:hypothetical protein